MAELHRDERLQPSLLDRLTDLEPAQKREALVQQSLTMVQLRRAVLRDLGWLLNATNYATVEDMPDTPLAAASTVNYGIPGFAGLISAKSRSGSLETAIATAVRNFEPRIKPESLRVRARARVTEDALPALVFEITGELWAQPVPQQLFLETSIEVETRLAVVTDVKARS